MKLATLRDGSRDGTLVVVSRDLKRSLPVPEVARTLQNLLDDWAALRHAMRIKDREVNNGVAGTPFDPAMCMAPLPRAYQWLDGSAYLNHVELVRRARGAAMPPEFYNDPLMYQGGSDDFLGPTDPITATDVAWGVDFESEIAVVTDDVPVGCSPENARERVLLVGLVNDVTLRNLVPAELAKGFGFLQSKPATAMSPVFVTPDELGDAWVGGKLHLPLLSSVNGVCVGQPNAGVEMQFDFGRLIAHAARTRRLVAGTVLGSGTVSNRDESSGVSCLAERRVREQLAAGKAVTPFLCAGDHVRIEVLDSDGQSVFGAIDQRVVIGERR